MNYRNAKISDIIGLARVQVDTWRTAYRNIISDETLQTLTYEEREQKWKQRLEKSDDKICIYVAEKGFQEVVGYVLASLDKSNPYIGLLQPERYIGELSAIYILEDYQRRKIGTELVKLVINYFLSKGVKSMIVWVLKDSPYRKFYEKLRGQYVGEQLIKIDKTNYVEVAYGWDRIEAILSR